MNKGNSLFYLFIGDISPMISCSKYKLTDYFADLSLYSCMKCDAKKHYYYNFKVYNTYWSRVNWYEAEDILCKYAEDIDERT